MKVYCGIDWAEAHHDVAVLDADGTLLARRRIRDNHAGYQQLLLLAEAGDSAEDPIPVAIKTSRGLLVAWLRATTGRHVDAINPLAVSRDRDRHSVAGTKSDHGDAVVLANSLRTDQAAHRPCQPTPSWPKRWRCWPAPSRTRSANRQQLANQLRSLLREYFPGPPAG